MKAESYGGYPSKSVALKMGLYKLTRALWYIFTFRWLIKREDKPRIGRKKYAGELIFFILLVAYPVAQFLIFYVWVNFNSILLAFKTYDSTAYTYYYSGFNNFKAFFSDIVNSKAMQLNIRNSFIFYAVSLFVIMPLNLFFSYFLYKKIPGTALFRVILFMPQVLSAIVMSIMFKFFVDRALPDVLTAIGIRNPPVFLVDSGTVLPTMLFYSVWASFGAQLLIYSSAMSRVPESLVEYGRLEGLSLWREFFSVTLPLIFPTVTTFLIVSIAAIFTNQAGLYNIYGNTAPANVSTLGYFFFVKVVGGENSFPDYPYASAGGLIFTIIAVPLTFLLKHILEKVSPVTEY